MLPYLDGLQSYSPYMLAYHGNHNFVMQMGHTLSSGSQRRHVKDQPGIKPGLKFFSVTKAVLKPRLLCLSLSAAQSSYPKAHRCSDSEHHVWGQDKECKCQQKIFWGGNPQRNNSCILEHFPVRYPALTISCRLMAC